MTQITGFNVAPSAPPPDDVQEEEFQIFRQGAKVGIRRTAGSARRDASDALSLVRYVLNDTDTVTTSFAELRISDASRNMFEGQKAQKAQDLRQARTAIQSISLDLDDITITPQSLMTQNPVWRATEARVVAANTPFQPKLSTSRHYSFECSVDSHQCQISHEEHSSSIPTSFQEGVKGRIMHSLEHMFGKSRSMLAEFVINMCIEGKCSERENPYRDLSISAATHIAISEVVALAMPHKKAYLVIVAAHLAGEIAENGKSAMDAMAKNQEVAEWWDRQVLFANEGLPFAHSVAQAQGLAWVTKFPSQLLHALHHEIGNYVTKIADQYGLTEKNIAQAAVRTLQFIAKHSPELCEERVWATTITEASTVQQSANGKISQVEVQEILAWAQALRKAAQSTTLSQALGFVQSAGPDFSLNDSFAKICLSEKPVVQEVDTRIAQKMQKDMT